MAALREAAILARRSRDNLQDFGAVPLQCPLCPDRPDMPMVVAVANLKVAEVHAALR